MLDFVQLGRQTRFKNAAIFLVTFAWVAFITAWLFQRAAVAPSIVQSVLGADPFQLVSRPWYTLEIEPGGTIRQKRSYSNEQYSDLQEAVPFLKEWQQVVQKRMDEKERKLAVESKEKRNKEFEELTVNGNIIHTGRYAGKLLVDELMKDLMEAAATA